MLLLREKILWINDTDIINLDGSMTARIIGSIIIKFDISDIDNIYINNIFYIGSSTSLHASMQYGDDVVFTSYSSECLGQLAVKIDEYDNCSFGVIPSTIINVINVNDDDLFYGS